MSGHSKWSQIKRKKEIIDQKRGAIFTKLAGQIKSAAKNDANPETNTALAEAIARAKQSNMPQENINRILGKSDNANNEQIIYEAFGPHGIALIIATTTDNARRTVAELRTILKKHNGSIGEPGSVMWKFDTSKNIVKPKYPLQLNQESAVKIQSLIDELTAQEDTDNIYSDIAE